MRLFIIMGILAMLVLAGCSLVVPEAGNQQEKKAEEATQPEKKVVTSSKKNYPPIDIDEMDASFTLLETEFVRSSPNEWGDESSFIQIRDTTDYTVSSEVTYKYSPGEPLKSRTVYAKVVDSTSEDVVATHKMLSGTNTESMVFTVEHTGMSPRFKYCFGYDSDFTIDEEKCLKLSGDSVSNKLDTSITKFNVNAGRDERDKTIIVSNDGTTALTVFVVFPTGSDFTLSTPTPSFNLDSLTQKTITINFEGDKDKNEETFYIYSIPKNCEPSMTCASNAKLRNEVEVSFN